MSLLGKEFMAVIDQADPPDFCDQVYSRKGVQIIGYKKFRPGDKKQFNEESYIKKKVKEGALIKNQAKASYLKALAFESRAPLSPATYAAYIHTLIYQ